MALTQRTGALARAGTQAQSIANTLANAAANLHYAPQPQRSFGQEPVYQPAPVYRAPQQQGSFTSGGSAAAAQHIIQQARNQQVARQNVFNDVAKQAVMSALAVATGQQPGRPHANDLGAMRLRQQPVPTGAGTPDQVGGSTSPPNEMTRNQGPIGPPPQPAYSVLPTYDTTARLTQETAVLQRFPQMTYDEVNALSGDQLYAFLHQPPAPPRYDPLSGPKAGTPRGVASAAGTPDQVGGSTSSPNPMTRNQPPKGPPPQPGYSPLPTWNTTIGAPAQPPYSPLPTGAAQVSAAFTDALNRGSVVQQTQGGQMADGGGGFLDTIKDVGGGLADSVLSPLGPLGTLLQGGKDFWGLLGDSVKEGYEAFTKTPVGQKVEQGMALLDRGRQENAQNYGQMFTQWANGETIAWMPGGMANPLNDLAALPVILIGEAWAQADPTIRDQIIAVSQQGYSSPSYVKVAESQGIDPVAQPEFTGETAVWEFLMGKTDGLPPQVKYPLRMMIDTVIDPLTYAGGAAALGAEARAAGIAMRTAEGSTTAGRTIGGVLEGLGATAEGAARLPDLPVEAAIKGGQGIGGRIGEVTGLLSPSTAGLRRDAEAAAADLDTAIVGARESIPDEAARVAFDAEAQGVAPTSGPELIDTPVRTEAPTVVAREGGEPTVTRSTGIATVERPVTLADDPRFRDYATMKEAEAAALSLHEDWRAAYGHTLRDDSLDGPSFVLRHASGMISETFKPRRLNASKAIYDAMPSAPDGYIITKNADGTWRPNMSAETKAAKAGDIAPSTASPKPPRTGTPPKSERVSPRSLSESRDLENYLRSEGADEATIEGAVRDFLAARFGDERDAAAATAKPTSRVEREAAAAAGSAPETPRSRGASETVRAAETAKGKTGTRKRLTAGERKSYGSLAKAQDRFDRLAKEDKEGLPKQVNKILGAQKPGEHEFSPIYGGHRPLDQIVTKAIDSKDPALMKQADAFVKKVDAAVEQHLRTDDFYKTWKNGGVPVRTFSPSGTISDEFMEWFRVLDPDADVYRLRVLANGLAKGTLDDIAEVQFQLNHLFPMLMESYPGEFGMDGALGAVGRIESKDFRAESSAWLIREYLDTPDPAKADVILQRFLTGETELPVLADGVHKPYAHSIVPEHQAESIARLQQMREQWRAIKRAERARNLSDRFGIREGWRTPPPEKPKKPGSALGFAQSDPIANVLLDDAGRFRLRQKWEKWFNRGVGEEQPIFGPDVAPGSTRLYRVEYAGPDKRPDHIRYAHIETGAEAARGRWFTADPGISHFYIEDIGDGGRVPVRIRYTDIPTAELDNWRVKNAMPDKPVAGVRSVDPRRYSLDPENEFWVTRTMAQDARILPTGEQARFTEYAGVRNDWFEEVAQELKQKPRGVVGFAATADPITEWISDAIVSQRQRRARNRAVREQSDAAFRAADVPAQLEGGKKSISKQMAAAMRATQHSVKATDEQVLAAIGEIKDAEIASWLLNGDGKLTVEQARLADRAMPETWRPPGYAGEKTGWNVKDALDWVREESLRTPSFDHRKAVTEIGELAHGLQPKRTAAQVRAMQKAAEAQGIDPKTIRDGTSTMERATATKGIRALDAYLRQYRALRLFNPIIGMGNRIGDVAGNSISHLIGRDVRSAIRQAPLTFTEAKAFRALGRDPEKLVAQWVETTPMMRELAATYDPKVLGASRLRDIDATTGLPPVNAKVAGTPRAVRTAASAWSSPALKDATTAGEMVGRKLAHDRVVTETIQREAWPALKEYLEGRFPGQSDELLKEIYASAQTKGGKEWSGYFSAGDVEKAIDIDASRKWQREVNRAIAKGGDEADHLFFNGRMTNADEIARRVLTFHFWMSRASALYGRTLLRNPVLLSGFYRIYERAHEIAQEQQLPGWLGTMMKFYTIPGAGSGYAAMDPFGALFPTFFLDAYSQEGNKFQALQNLMLPPWSAALGALGLTQNVPDLAGTRSLERFVIDMGNFLKGEGIDLESIPLFGKFINTDSLTFKIPTEEFTKALIEKANGLLGTPLGDFKPFDRAANEQDQLYSIGEQVAQGLWGEDMSAWSEAQVAELTAAVTQAQYGEGEETWLSETIRAAYGREGAARAFGALAVPGGLVTRQGFRDSQIDLSHTYWDDFYAGKPTTKAGESAAAGRQLATSAQPVWVAMNTDYYKIGTKQEQTIYASVNDMLYSPEDLNPHQSIIIDNGNGMFTVYSMSQLAGLSDDERSQVVSTWLDQNKGVSDAYTKVKEGRATFKDEHPDYAQYSEYQKGVFGYSGGPTQFRRDMADNPTFKAAEDAQRAQLKKEGKSGAVLEAELDHWATTQAAFFAATGQKYKTTDQIKGTPGPSSVAAMFSLRPEKDEGGSSGGKKPAEKKDPTVDDYWSPEKGVPRLANDQAQYEHDNAKMEADFGPYWNEATADWEDNADSAKERDKLGIGDNTYVTPSVSETMRRYEDWEEDHPGGSPEEFFAEMLQTEGFGKKVQTEQSAPTLPGGTVITKPAGAAAYPNTPIGRLQAASQQLQGVGRESVPAPKTGAPRHSGDSGIISGAGYRLLQPYGMTPFAQTQSGPGGMYEYTNQYTKDGSYVGHMGVDVGVKDGTPIYAPVSGTVVQSGGVDWEQDYRYGDTPGTGGLRIELPNGDLVVLGHMSQITVDVGDTVNEGDQVGLSGMSQYDPNDSGSGPHVHVEYRQYAPGITGSGYLAIDPRTKLDLGV